jgi:hypothetical protein
MTRAISPENLVRLQAGHFIARDFVRFVVRLRDTGAPVEDAYWSDVYPITADVIDPDTGGVASYDFAPAGGLISIGDIALVSNLTVQTVQIKLAQASPRVNTLLRAYDCKQGRVEVYRGMFDPDSRNIVAPAFPRFVGTIDQAPVTTPKENEAGDVTLTCTGNTQELRRSNPDTRSDASQRLRSATDNFFADVAVVSDWQQFWGKAGGPIRTTPSLASALSGLTSLAGLFKR